MAAVNSSLHIHPPIRIIILGFGGYLILRSKKGRTTAFVTIGALAGAVLMSTSRGVMMWSAGNALVIMAAFVWGAPRKQKEASRVIRSIQRVILLGGVAIVALSVIFPEQVNSRLAIYSETLSPYSTASELAFRTREYPMANFLPAFRTPRWMYGYGTGTASLGTQYIARVLHVPPMGINVENGYGQLVIEIGVVGLLLWLVLGASVAIAAWKLSNNCGARPGSRLRLSFSGSSLWFCPRWATAALVLSGFFGECLSLDFDWDSIQTAEHRTFGAVSSGGTKGRQSLSALQPATVPSVLATNRRL